MNDRVSAEIAATAARLVVDEGMEYGPAKRKASRLLGARQAQWPDNLRLEDEVREYLALFHAETQPMELKALRELTLEWMARLAAFRPYVSGAVWRGTATRLSSIHLQLFCDDAKSTEIELINRGIDYAVGSITGPRGDPVDVLSVSVPCPAFAEPVTLHLSILDHDDLRGALKGDTRGRTERGDAAALRRLMTETSTEDSP